MTVSALILGWGEGFAKVVNYELIRGNVVWRFGLVLLIALAALLTGRIVSRLMPVAKVV